MATTPIEIIPFEDHHQPGIDIFMTALAKEFPENIFSPQFKKVKEVALLPGHKYWVAQAGDNVIGTAGLLTLAGNNAEFKRMFLDKKFRGQGIAKTLLDTVINAAVNNKVSWIFLGTMTQFKAAQSFYEKNGFIQIPQALLPADFSINPIDKVFYKKDLK
jgi:N-acetylglutamate synthase-like GNAT family acetyltransferase